MKRNLSYAPYLILVLLFLLSTLFSFEYWPITNFQVFRSPKRIMNDQLEIYFWYYFDTRNQKWVRIPHRNSHTHDSFSISLTELISQNKTTEERNFYLKTYITGELKLRGIYKDSIKVRISQKRINYASQVETKDRRCFQLKDHKYCIYEETISEITI